MSAPLSFVPASIPSPPAEWAAFPVGQWIRDAGLTWFPFDTTIRTYALCILAGIAVAILMTRARLKSRGAEPGVVYDIAIFAVGFGIVGARTYHVLTHLDDYFFPGAQPWNIFVPGSVPAVWEGGIAIFGALIGGAFGVWLGCRLTGVRFWTFADALVPGLLLAQAFGRFGNWFNQELYGWPTDLPWGLEIDPGNPAFPAGLPDDTLFHPTFLYEVIWNVIGVIALLAAEKHFRKGTADVAGATIPVPVPVGYRLQWGRLTGLYLVWYGTGRMFFESIRLDPSELILGARVNVWGAFAALVIGFIIIIVQGRRHPGREPGPYLPGREWSPEAAVDSDDTYPDDDPESGDGSAADDDAELVTAGTSTHRSVSSTDGTATSSKVGAKP